MRGSARKDVVFGAAGVYPVTVPGPNGNPGLERDAREERGTIRHGGDGNRLGGMNTIVDNMQRRVGDFLRERIKVGANLSIVSAYFTIYAYEALRDVLEHAADTRFLYGEPRGVGAMDPDGNEVKSFRLNEDGGIDLKKVLVQKPLARACAAWIQKRVDIRTVKRANFCTASSITSRARMVIPLPLSAAPTSHGAGWGSVRRRTLSSISKPVTKMTGSRSYAGSTFYGATKPSPVTPSKKSWRPSNA